MSDDPGKTPISDGYLSRYNLSIDDEKIMDLLEIDSYKIRNSNDFAQKIMKDLRSKNREREILDGAPPFCSSPQCNRCNPTSFTRCSIDCKRNLNSDLLVECPYCLMLCSDAPCRSMGFQSFEDLLDNDSNISDDESKVKKNNSRLYWLPIYKRRFSSKR